MVGAKKGRQLLQPARSGGRARRGTLLDWQRAGDAVYYFHREDTNCYIEAAIYRR